MTFLKDETWNGQVYSGGWITPEGGTAAVIEPATGHELGRIGIATPADVTRAVRKASEAQRAWAATPHTERSAILRRAALLWEENAAEIEGWVIRETGKIGPAAQFETHVSVQEIYQSAGLPSRPYGELLPSEKPRLSFAERVPVGVVGVIAPFNFPQILSIRSVAPALALGNAVVLKPDPRTSVSGGVVLARVFEEAGLPDGLLHVLPGGPDVGEALITDPLVRIISFTGSTAVGRRIGELAARHLKRAHLELGGNSALVVLDDADVAAAASAGAWGSFLHQGQICMTTGRHLVADKVYDDYVAAMAEKASHLPVGDPASGHGRARPDHRRAAARQGARAGHRVHRPGRQARRRRHLRGPVLPAHRARGRHHGHARLRQRGVRPGRPGPAVQRLRRGRPGSPRTPSTACPSASSPRT